MEAKREDERWRAIIETLNAAERLLAASAGVVEELGAELEAAADRRAARRGRAEKKGRGWLSRRWRRIRRPPLARRMERLLKELDLPTRSEITALNERLDELNARLDEMKTV